MSITFIKSNPYLLIRLLPERFMASQKTSNLQYIMGWVNDFKIDHMKKLLQTASSCHESHRKLIEEQYQAVYGSIFTLVHDRVQRGEFHPSQPVETIVHWLISFIDGLFLESIINGFERIELANPI